MWIRGRKLNVAIGCNGSRLCENMLDALELSFAWIAGVAIEWKRKLRLVVTSDFIMPFGPRQRPKQPLTDEQSAWIHALIASSSPAMPKMLIIRLRL
jgi:hypothetical protein